MVYCLWTGQPYFDRLKSLVNVLCSGIFLMSSQSFSVEITRSQNMNLEEY